MFPFTHSIATHILKATTKSTADHNLVNLFTPGKLKPSMSNSWLKQCTNNDDSVEVAEFHEPPTIIVTFVKMVFPHHKSKRGFVGAQPAIQIIHHHHNITFEFNSYCITTQHQPYLNTFSISIYY